MPQQCLLGNLPGFVHSHDGFPQPGDVFWSPADWAWTGGLMDALLPTLYFGCPIVGYRGRFDPERALALMAKYRVTQRVPVPDRAEDDHEGGARTARALRARSLRSIMSAGEAVGTTVFAWAQDALGVTINEMFGQTEMNYIVGNSHALWPAKPGSMGRPVSGPSHRACIDDAGSRSRPTARLGEVAVNRIAPDGVPDPVFFLEYFKNPEGTAHKFSGDWCRTGDLATRDADGYLWYQGRADDMFKAAGYRIGPSEIENCLVKHPAVANAAVVPSPDETRGNVVKAFIVLAPGHDRRRPRSRRRSSDHVRKLPRALRVSEGDRIHRRVADDDDGQGAAAGAARARTRRKKTRSRVTATDALASRSRCALAEVFEKASVHEHPDDRRRDRRQDQRAELVGRTRSLRAATALNAELRRDAGSDPSRFLRKSAMTLKVWKGTSDRIADRKLRNGCGSRAARVIAASSGSPKENRRTLLGTSSTAFAPRCDRRPPAAAARSRR